MVTIARRKSHCRRRLWLLIALAVAACGSHSEDPPPVTNADADRDGFAAAADCDDTNAGVWRMLDVFTDSDSDGLGTGSAVTRCAGASSPAGFAIAAGDCDDSNSALSQTLSVFVDADADGRGTGSSPLSQCSGPTPSAGFATASGDCADDDPAKFATLLYSATDKDFDNHFLVGSGSLCGGATLPTGYFASVPTSLLEALIECDDQNFAVWRNTGIYVDIDGDGTGSGGVQVRCIGQHAPVGYSLLGYDPIDSLTDTNSALISNLELSTWLLLVP
jgi:hypothetical protein